MLFTDFIIHDVDVDAQRNPFKNTAVKIKITKTSCIIYFLYPEFFILL